MLHKYLHKYRVLLMSGALLAGVWIAAGSTALADGGPPDLIHVDPSDVYMPFGNVYSQVVVSDDNKKLIHVAGTVSLDINRNFVGIENPQTDQEKLDNMRIQVQTTLENIRRSLAAVGATPLDVVRVHIYATDVFAYLVEGTPQQLPFFGGIGNTPASTLAGVTRLADPRYVVEIEVDAVRKN